METYEKSNSISTVSLNKFSNKEYNALLNTGSSISERQKVAQSLCDYLCKKFKIKGTDVIVLNRCQPHKTGSTGNLKRKRLGSYTIQTRVITLYNLTAIKKHVVSPKVFASTLLHEFMHHYDMEYLKLQHSLHTTGFYKRISDLQGKLS